MRKWTPDRRVAAVWILAIFTALLTTAATWAVKSTNYSYAMHQDGPDTATWTSRFAARLDDTGSLHFATRAVLYLAGREGSWTFGRVPDGPKGISSVSKGGTSVDVGVRTPILAPSVGSGVDAFLDDEGRPVLAISMTYRNQCRHTLAALSADPYLGGRFDARMEGRNERIPKPAAWTPIGRTTEVGTPDRGDAGIDAVCPKQTGGNAYGPDEADEIWIRPRIR